MKKLPAATATLLFLTTAAFAEQPLSDEQMDTVAAGFSSFIVVNTNPSVALVTVNGSPDSSHVTNFPVREPSCVNCYLNANAGFVQVPAFIGGRPM